MFTNIHLYLDFHLVIIIKKRISKYKYTEGEMFSNISSLWIINEKFDIIIMVALYVKMNSE